MAEPREPTATQSTGTASGAAYAPLAALAPGDRIGRYRVVDKLGEGGMGQVVRAHDPQLERVVALKLLKRSSKDGNTRLLGEAKALARLAHPNVIAVFDAGIDDQRVFVAMELVDGENLREWLLRHRPPRREILRVLLEAGRGIAAAHAAGIVHRDVKPTNILVGNDGRARVADFGLARSPLDDAEPDAPPGRSLSSGITATGQVVGTPAYMAPEQFGAGATARSDQYAFFVTAYEALCGRLPHQATTVEDLAREKRALAAAPPRGRLPRRLWAVLARGLSPDERDRFPSMNAALAALAGAARGWVPAAALGGFALLGVAAGALLLVDPSWRREGCGSLDLGALPAAEIRAAFARAAPDWGTDAATRVLGALEPYGAAWAGRRQKVCEDHQRRALSAEAHDLVVSCLGERRRALDALAAQLAAAQTGEQVARGVDASLALAPLESCDDVQALRARTPPPGEPGRRAAAAALAGRLAELQARADAGEHPEALVAVAGLAPLVAAVDHPPLTAAARLLEGQLLAERFDPRALAVLSEAARAATAAGDDEIAAQAWILAFGEHSRRARGDNAALLDELAVLAEAAIARSKRPEQLIVWHAERAQLALSRGELERAAEQVGRSLALAEMSGRAAGPAAFEALSARGRLEQRQERLADARRTVERMVEIGAASFGRAHPRLVAPLTQLARITQRLGEPRAAIGLLERALAIAERSGGRAATVVQVDLATAYADAGDVEPARAMYRRAIAGIEDGVHLAAALQGLAQLQDGEERVATARRALAIYEQRLGAGKAMTEGAAGVLGAALLDARRPAEARPLLERAAACASCAPPVRAPARAALAVARLALGERAPEVRALVEQAAADAPAVHGVARRALDARLAELQARGVAVQRNAAASSP